MAAFFKPVTLRLRAYSPTNKTMVRLIMPFQWPTAREQGVERRGERGGAERVEREEEWRGYRESIGAGRGEVEEGGGGKLEGLRR